MTDEMTRSTEANPFGKLTEELRTLVDESTKEGVIALSFSLGMTPSEYLRRIVQAHVHGHAQVLRLSARNAGAMAGLTRE